MRHRPINGRRCYPSTRRSAYIANPIEEAGCSTLYVKDNTVDVEPARQMPLDRFESTPIGNLTTTVSGGRSNACLQAKVDLFIEMHFMCASPTTQPLQNLLFFTHHLQPSPIFHSLKQHIYSSQRHRATSTQEIATLPPRHRARASTNMPTLWLARW